MKKEIKLRIWQNQKPDFPCVFVTRYKINNEWEYELFVLKKTNGYDKDGNPARYLGIFEQDGDEWGDWNDFVVGEYFILQKL